MNYLLSSRNEIRTPQFIVSYSGYLKNFKVLTAEVKADKHPVGISFDVQWADDAFFDTLQSISRWALHGDNSKIPIEHFFAYETPEHITIEINENTWRFRKPSPTEGDTTPNPPT